MKKINVKKYVCKGVQHTQMIPVRNDKGELVQKKYPNGDPMYQSNGAPVYLTKSVKFLGKLTDARQNETCCVLETNDPDVISEMDKVDIDPNHPVVTAERYEEEMAPKEFALKKENEDLVAKNKELQDKVAKLLAGQDKK